MTLLKQRNLQAEEKNQAENQREQFKQELRQKINVMLQYAKELPPEQCLREIRSRLFAIQHYCAAIGKTFIAIEEMITCDQYELGGNYSDTATLFRGPNVDASVAICVTKQGSLLHRNSGFWRIYRDAGDVNLAVFK
jgi:hypothetical protein